MSYQNMRNASFGYRTHRQNNGSRVRRSEQWRAEENEQPFLMGLTKAELLSNKRHRTAPAAAASPAQAFPILSAGTRSTVTPTQGYNNVYNAVFPRMMHHNAGGGLPMLVTGTPVSYVPLVRRNMLHPYAGFPRMNLNVTLGYPGFGSVSEHTGTFSRVNGNYQSGFPPSVRPLYRRRSNFPIRQGLVQMSAVFNSAYANEARVRAFNQSASADNNVWLGHGQNGSSIVGSQLRLLPMNDAQPSIGNAQVNIMEAQHPANNVIPLTLSGLLEAGIFDGQTVKYISLAPQVILNAIIEDGAFLCSCERCEETLQKTLDAAEFAQHANCNSITPTRNIYFPNGRNLWTVMDVLQATPDERLYDVLQNITGNPINPEVFARSRLVRWNTEGSSSRNSDGRGFRSRM